MAKEKRIYIRPSVESISLDRCVSVFLGSKKDNDHTHPTVPDEEILSDGGNAKKSITSEGKVFPDRPF